MLKNMLESRGAAVLMVLIGAVSYGLLSVLVKAAYTDLTVAQVTTGQILLGAAMLWLLVLARPRSWSNPFKGAWVQLSMIGIFGLFMTTLFFNQSLSYMDASISIVLLFQFTWITILIDSVFRRAWPGMWQIISVVVILVGTLLAVNILEQQAVKWSAIGISLGIASAFTYAGFIYFTGRVKTDLDPTMRSAIMWTAPIPLVFLIWPPTYVANVDFQALLFWGLLLGLLGQVIPTITFNAGIPRIGSSLAALIGSIELPAAIIFAYLILAERVSPIQWFGVVLITGGIVLAEVKQKAERRGT